MSVHPYCSVVAYIGLRPERVSARRKIRWAYASMERGQHFLIKIAQTGNEPAYAYRRLIMKNTVSTWATALVFVGSLGLACAHASTTSQASYKKPIEVTGCLQQGPIAREYLLYTNDGNVWELSSADKEMYMNNYVGQTVTVAGDPVHSKAGLKTVATDEGSQAVKGHLRAMDLVVDSEKCQK